MQYLRESIGIDPPPPKKKNGKAKIQNYQKELINLSSLNFNYLIVLATFQKTGIVYSSLYVICLIPVV